MIVTEYPGRERARIEGFELFFPVDKFSDVAPSRLGDDLHFRLQAPQFPSKFIPQLFSSFELRSRFGTHLFKPSDSRLGLLEQVVPVLQLLRNSHFHCAHQVGDATGLDHGMIDHLLLAVERKPPAVPLRPALSLKPLVKSPGS
jgi:hypothetical protein